MKRRNGRSRSIWAILVVVAMVIAACSADPATDTTADGSDTTVGGEEPTETTAPPDEGSDTTAAPSGDVSNPDTFVHAADDEALSLDPAQVEPGEGGETIILQVFDRLIDFTPEGPDLIPALSEEVPTDDNGLISEDGLTYT
ncbi:MAG TPA: hypothetical protein VMS99_03185, partial [Acidimicrobiia bacterium]|nr:hypothetical protein [Acidimicrobiia bacterium]